MIARDFATFLLVLSVNPLTTIANLLYDIVEKEIRVRCMILIDGLGNTLELNDLVAHVDDKGQMHLCLLSRVFEREGIAQLMPLPMIVRFDIRNPHVPMVFKLVKPPNFEQKAS